MGRIKAAQNKPANKNTIASTSSSANGKTYNALELLDRAETILNDSGNIELAAQFTARARPACSNEEERWRCDEVDGMIAMENGQEDRAIELFHSCKSVSSTALLYLAQLSSSPQEALSNFTAAVDLLSKKVDLQGGSYSSSIANGKDKMWSETERQTRTQICSALVSMTELYLTDLCFEPDAEARCGEYLDLALRVDAGADLNSEIYSTLASVRLSQARPQEAHQALQKSYSIWADLPPDSPFIPSYEARLNLVKLFIECEDLSSALDVLDGLEEENDEELEMLYLLALVNFLQGEKEQDTEAQKTNFIDARETLERFLQVSSRKPQDETDLEMMEQIKEMIGKIEKDRGITMKQVEEANQLAAARQAEEDGQNEGWVDEDEEMA